ANGSIKMPKFVISFCLRAIWPSKKSLMPPAQKSASAKVSREGTLENITARKAMVKTRRETVSLFGRFILQLRANCRLGLASARDESGGDSRTWACEPRGAYGHDQAGSAIKS